MFDDHVYFGELSNFIPHLSPDGPLPLICFYPFIRGRRRLVLIGLGIASKNIPRWKNRKLRPWVKLFCFQLETCLIHDLPIRRARCNLLPPRLGDT